MTQKEKQFLKALLGHGYLLQAMSSEYDENDEKSFKEHYGVSFKKAELIVDKFLNSL